MTDILIASTSHDMRTPLNSICNMHEIIEKEITDPKVLKWLKVANTSTNLLLFLVNDTLDFYQIKSGKFICNSLRYTIDYPISPNYF